MLFLVREVRSWMCSLARNPYELIPVPKTRRKQDSVAWMLNRIEFSSTHRTAKGWSEGSPIDKVSTGHKRWLIGSFFVAVSSLSVVGAAWELVGAAAQFWPNFHLWPVGGERWPLWPLCKQDSQNGELQNQEIPLCVVSVFMFSDPNCEARDWPWPADQRVDMGLKKNYICKFLERNSLQWKHLSGVQGSKFSCFFNVISSSCFRRRYHLNYCKSKQTWLKIV